MSVLRAFVNYREKFVYSARGFYFLQKDCVGCECIHFIRANKILQDKWPASSWLFPFRDQKIAQTGSDHP